MAIATIFQHVSFARYKVLARKDDDAAAKGFEGGVELVLDQTAEFCRGLGEVGESLKFEDVEFDLTRLGTGKICSLA